MDGERTKEREASRIRGTSGADYEAQTEEDLDSRGVSPKQTKTRKRVTDPVAYGCHLRVTDKRLFRSLKSGLLQDAHSTTGFVP